MGELIGLASILAKFYVIASIIVGTVAVAVIIIIVRHIIKMQKDIHDRFK